MIVDLFYIDFFTYLLLVAHFLVSTMNLQRLQQSGFCLATSGYVLKHLSCFDEVCGNDVCHSFPNMRVLPFSTCAFHRCPRCFCLVHENAEYFNEPQKAHKNLTQRNTKEAKHKGIEHTLITCYTFLVCRAVRMLS